MNLQTDEHIPAIWRCDYKVAISTKFKKEILSEEIRQNLPSLLKEELQSVSIRMKEVDILPNMILMRLSISPEKSLTKTIRAVMKKLSKKLIKTHPTYKLQLPLFASALMVTTEGQSSDTDTLVYMGSVKTAYSAKGGQLT